MWDGVEQSKSFIFQIFLSLIHQKKMALNVLRHFSSNNVIFSVILVQRCREICYNFQNSKPAPYFTHFTDEWKLFHSCTVNLLVSLWVGGPHCHGTSHSQVAQHHHSLGRGKWWRLREGEKLKEGHLHSVDPVICHTLHRTPTLQKEAKVCRKGPHVHLY